VSFVTWEENQYLRTIEDRPKDVVKGIPISAYQSGANKPTGSTTNEKAPVDTTSTVTAFPYMAILLVAGLMIVVFIIARK
jgi:hypothetical protein